MKIAAVIAEYNPFHNGHLYLVDKLRKEAGADYIITVMSGDFTQRGTPALIDKYTRAKAAVSCGVDAVFELPVLYATSSAEQFAAGGVSLLHSLGCIDLLGFGSETGSIDELSAAAELLSEEPVGLQQTIRKNLKLGFSYPQAIVTSIREMTGKSSTAADLLETPNNLLGIEYMKAIKRFSSSIQPYTFARIGVNHNDKLFITDKETKRTYASASAIRSYYESKISSISYTAPLMPPAVYHLLSDAYGVSMPICMDDFSLLLSYRLSMENSDSLSNYLDVSSDLANRIANNNSFSSFSEFIGQIKHKQYTYARINRSLLHILLNITSVDMEAAPYAPYARLLAMNKNASELMKKVKQSSSIPIITKAADRDLSSEAEHTFEMDIMAANLYQKVVSVKYRVPYTDDIRHSIGIV